MRVEKTTLLLSWMALWIYLLAWYIYFSNSTTEEIHASIEPAVSILDTRLIPFGDLSRLFSIVILEVVGVIILLLFVRAFDQLST